LKDYRVDERRVQSERVKGYPDFAGSEYQGGSCPGAASDDTAPSRVLHSNRLVEGAAAVDQRMPVISIRQPRNHSADKAKHSQALNDVETNDRENSDHRSDQSRADKALVSGYANDQAQPQERKADLDEDAKRDVHENARRRSRYRCTMKGREAGTDHVSANGSGRHERAY